MIKAEFHTHTRFSQDSLLGKYAYLFMLKLRKINVIAVTDHNTIKGAVYLKPFLKKHNIDVIVGEEIFTTEGEIIGLFLKDEIPYGMTPEKTVTAIKNQGGIVYIPHPYDEKRYKTVLKEKAILNLKDKIDLMEIHNGRNISPRYSAKQTEIADKYTITPIVGSDAHTIAELGRNYVVMQEFSNSDDFLQKIKSAQFFTKKSIKVSHHITKAVRLIKLATAGKFNEICRIIKRKFKS